MHFQASPFVDRLHDNDFLSEFLIVLEYLADCQYYAELQRDVLFHEINWIMCLYPLCIAHIHTYNTHW